jgi:transcriptional regulator with XRE-family HTH domain
MKRVQPSEQERRALGQDESRQVLDRIGQRLREVRQARGLSLAQVALTADLTRGFLSQVELGDASPSVSSLVRLAASLGIEVAELFERPSSPLVRRGEVIPTMMGGKGVVDYVLTPQAERRAQLLETHLEPGGFADEQMWTRAGELAICHVKSGTLELRIEHEVFVLASGDTLTFDPTRPHTWRNPSRRYRTTVLWVDVPAVL